MKNFINDAIRTESVIESVKCDPELLKLVLKTTIAAGEMLDALKKNIYYNRTNNDISKHVDELFSIASTLKSSYQLTRSYDDTLKTDLNVNTRIFHGIIGKATENVELLSALLKYIETGELDKVNLKEEMGDDMWYDAILLDELDTTFEQVQSTIIKKLQKRYPEKYSDDCANNRDLDSERDILENN